MVDKISLEFIEYARDEVNDTISTIYTKVVGRFLKTSDNYTFLKPGRKP